MIRPDAAVWYLLGRRCPSQRDLQAWMACSVKHNEAESNICLLTLEEPPCISRDERHELIDRSSRRVFWPVQWIWRRWQGTLKVEETTKAHKHYVYTKHHYRSSIFIPILWGNLDETRYCCRSWAWIAFESVRSIYRHLTTLVRICPDIQMEYVHRRRAKRWNDSRLLSRWFLTARSRHIQSCMRICGQVYAVLAM